MRPRRLLKTGILTTALTCLFILTPSSISAQKHPQEYAVHTIQPGESLRDIALFYAAPLDEIVALNGITDIDSVHWGAEVIIPVYQEKQSATAVGAGETSADRSGESLETIQHTTYTVQRGDTLLRIALRFNTSLSDLITANSLADADRIYVGQQILVPTGAGSAAPTPAESYSMPLPDDTVPPPVPTLAEGKQIVVVLSQQRTYAFENGTLVRQFLVSTGLPATPTVRGDFAIYLKVPSQRMTGPGYDLPGVPWVMYFYKGYSFHGTYWHNNFGFPMSHGCVNMRTPEAEWLYAWAPVGTSVAVIQAAQ